MTTDYWNYNPDGSRKPETPAQQEEWDRYKDIEFSTITFPEPSKFRQRWMAFKIKLTLLCRAILYFITFGRIS